MNDLVPHPIASVLFGLAVVAFFFWPVSEEKRLPNRSAQFLGMSVSRSLSKPGVPIKKPQADWLAPLQKRDERPKPTTKTYYRVTVPDSGTLEAGEVVIKLNGIVARPADAQCQDEKGKSGPAAPQRRRR
jgi:hypothetical protein